MILGLSVQDFTLFHVILSLVGIGSGLVWLLGLVAGRWLPVWDGAFLMTTVATTLTGFLFPITVFTPALGVGLISTLALTIAIVARYAFHLRGRWLGVHVGAAALALYLNAFVAVVQSFLKIGALNALAPNGNEPPFALAQGIVLVIVASLGFLAWRRRAHP
ncbi:MAG: hypothetical protein OJI70_14810 [Zavarzinia sp.]|nr:hypothetical protein [Zavarzinia sp.]